MIFGSLFPPVIILANSVTSPWMSAGHSLQLILLAGTKLCGSSFCTPYEDVKKWLTFVQSLDSHTKLKAGETLREIS